jgi:hypothetical protein
MENEFPEIVTSVEVGISNQNEPIKAYIFMQKGKNLPEELFEAKL